MRRACLVVGLFAMLCAPAWAQVQAIGEFQVNTITLGYQDHPSVAMDGNGDFVVVWQAFENSSTYTVPWRKFNSAGVALNGGIANTYTTNSHFEPAVASDARGNFVVVWASLPQDGDGWGVFARRFDASGVPQGPELKVNGHTADSQRLPAVAVAGNGNFVVAWESHNQDGDDYGIFARIFDPTGTPIAGFQVNTYTTGFQSFPAVAADASGNFVVVWAGAGSGDDKGTFARRFDAAGSALGTQFRVNTSTLGFGILEAPAVAMDASGNFVVVYSGSDNTDAAGDVRGQRFNASGAAQASEFVVNAYTTNAQHAPSVAYDAKGNFVVTWESVGQDGSAYGIFGRRFNGAGVALGSEFQANTYTTSYQFWPDVASSPDGDFVVVWTSAGQDGSGNGVFGKRFGDLIFEDNFESGDMSRWSTSLNDGTDLAVTSGSALAGTTKGLRALVNDTNSLYVQDDTPTAESRYRVRFYLHPNGFDPGEAQSHRRVRIFLAHDISSQRVVTIVLKRLAGQYSIEALTRLNDGTRADTGFFDITDAAHFVEFDWRRATGPAASDGSLVLSIDDTPVMSLLALDNDQMRVSDGRMGVMSVKTGATGTLFFDQFESRRLNPIGPE